MLLRSYCLGARVAAVGLHLGLRSGGAHLVKARTAVDRPILPRIEGHEGVCAALRANYLMHVTLNAPVALLAFQRTARRAPLRIVLQTLQRVELLFSHGESEVRLAVSTLQVLV